MIIAKPVIPDQYWILRDGDVKIGNIQAEPADVKAAVDEAIREQVSHRDIGQVGVRFMKFCGRYELNRASEQAEQFGRWLTATYQGVLDDSGKSSDPQPVLDTQAG